MSEFSAHAQERARERYGLNLTGSDMRGLLAQCKSGKAMPFQRQTIPPGVERIVWGAKFGEITVVFITNAAADFIVSFLPQNYFKSGNGRKRRQWRAKTNKAIPEDICERKFI